MEHSHHGVGLLFANDQLLCVGISAVSEWDRASDPSAVSLEVGARLRDSRGGKISLELRKRRQDVQHQFVQRRRPQARRRHYLQRDVVFPKFLEEGGEVPQIPRKLSSL
jgi:hypothetical protein